MKGHWYLVMIRTRLLLGFSGPKALEWAMDCVRRHPGAHIEEVTP